VLGEVLGVDRPVTRGAIGSDSKDDEEVPPPVPAKWI
jgi:hypothetical protein